MPDRRQLHVRPPGARRAVVVGAGSFGTAVAVLLARGGLRTTLQARTTEQAQRLSADRENRDYLPGVELPGELRIETIDAGLARADLVFLGVPSQGLDDVIGGLEAAGLPDRAAVVSLAKGLVPPDGTAPTIMLGERLGAARVACLGGPAHAREMVHEGAGLVAASTSEELAGAIARAFTRAGVVCERSNDPVGRRARGRRQERRGAGLRRHRGARASTPPAPPPATSSPRSGASPRRAGRGRSRSSAWRARATSWPPRWRRRAATGGRASCWPTASPPPRSRPRIGQAVEALESVPLLARALERAGVEAPVTTGLARLISGELPLDDWVALVRTTVPPPARWRVQPGFWRRAWARVRGAFGGRRRRRPPEAGLLDPPPADRRARRASGPSPEPGRQPEHRAGVDGPPCAPADARRGARRRTTTPARTRALTQRDRLPG